MLRTQNTDHIYGRVETRGIYSLNLDRQKTIFY